jgi:adenosylcobinamide amidohydrolase
VNWEFLARSSNSETRRRGRFIVVDLKVPHRAISTSVRNGGQTEHLRHLVNHQSCEGSGHDVIFEIITARGEEAYHDLVCTEADLPGEHAAVMGTAANMNYASVVTRTHDGVEVLAVVTAGVQTNATCAGDPAVWSENKGGFVSLPHGTINCILVVNTPVAVSALARIVSVMTEAKSAALQRLAVPSRYSADLATGTGTDQYCVAAPVDGRAPLTSASPHTKFGEIVGLAVRDATVEALRWQNGLEPSYTRSLFHALGRYGLTEQTIFESLKCQLDAADFELLKKNSKSVFYEPHVGASAHAIAVTLDRVRHGSLPDSCAGDALVQQAAILAANLAAKPDQWPEYYRLLQQATDDPHSLVTAAIALGWREKWRRA